MGADVEIERDRLPDVSLATGEHGGAGAGFGQEQGHDSPEDAVREAAQEIVVVVPGGGSFGWAEQGHDCAAEDAVREAAADEIHHVQRWALFDSMVGGRACC